MQCIQLMFENVKGYDMIYKDIYYVVYVYDLFIRKYFDIPDF